MTPQAALTELLDRLAAQQGAAVHIGNDELNTWPAEAVAAMKAARVLVKARPASSIVCPGCERECAMPVDVFRAEDGRPARAFISCDKPEDMGLIPVELRTLERWQVTGEVLAGALNKLFGFTKPPQQDATGKRWALGILKGKEDKGAITLSIENGVLLILDGHNIPPVHVLTLDQRGLTADKDALLRMVDGDTQQPASGVGSAAWRKQKAKAAANARHSKPGGSREKQDRIRAAWATGKYTTRDICAEQECAALDMSFAAARKALRNTPDPKGPSRC